MAAPMKAILRLRLEHPWWVGRTAKPGTESTVPRFPGKERGWTRERGMREIAHQTRRPGTGLTIFPHARPIYMKSIHNQFNEKRTIQNQWNSYSNSVLGPKSESYARSTTMLKTEWLGSEVDLCRRGLKASWDDDLIGILSEKRM